MEIILVRHTTPNVEFGTCYGQTDLDVAPTFTEEATATLQALAPYLPVDKAFTSPLIRAAKLAGFCGFSNAVKDSRLKEMNMGEWEMQKYDQIKDPAIKAWYNDYMNIPATGGESFRDLYSRVSSFLDELKTKPYSKAIIFAHAGPIVCAALYAGASTEDNIFSIAPAYGGITRINI